LTAIDDIQEGVYDGQLGDVIQAVLDRIVETESTLNWRITLDGDTWDAETVSLTELGEAEKLAKTSYLNLDPTRQAGHLVALVVAHFIVFGGLKIQAAIEKASKYTAADLKDIVSLYETAAVGKDDGGTSTNS
jgi:hypothetical protein